MNPDFNDPFAPNLLSERPVTCLHCGQTFSEQAIKWSEAADLWVCPYWPVCDGAGYGFDILPAEELKQ